MQGFRVILKRVLFLGLLLSSLFSLVQSQSVWAAQLTHVFITAGDDTPGAVTNYHVHYHNTTPLPLNTWVVDLAFPAGYVLPTTCGPGGIRLIVGNTNVACSDLVLYRVGNIVRISPNQTIPTNTFIDVHLDTVQNTTAQGRYPMPQLRIANMSDLTIDNVTPIPSIGQNIPPMISGSPITEINQNDAYAFTASATDAEGHTLTFSLSNNPSWMTINSITGQVSGTPGNDDVGTHHNVVVAVSDGFSTVTLAPFTVQVHNVNDAPTITGIAQNSVDQNVPYHFSPFGEDIDGDAISFSIVNKPNWLEFDTANGQLFGTPAQADVGFYAGIEIEVTDGELSSTLPAFDITVNDVNDPPFINGSPALFVMQDQEYVFTPDVMDYEAMPLSFSSVNLPAWLTLDAATGLVIGTPGNNDVGVYHNIVISVSDGLLSTALPPFSIEVINVNDVPVISGEPSKEVQQDAPYSFRPVAEDVDGDSLIFTIINKPSWANFDSTTGELSGVPENADVGIYNDIRIGVTDGQVRTTLPSFNIEVLNVNDAPLLEGDPPQTVNQDELYEFVPVATDDDGDELVFSVQNQPGWANFDTTTGTLSGMPGQGDVGVTRGIVLSVSDGVESASLPAFDIEVLDVNDAPSIMGTPASRVAELQPYHFQPSASDADGDELLFSIAGLPAWASFDALTGTLSGEPGYQDQGSYGGIVISVSDGVESTALPTFSIEVENVNRPPSISGNPPTQVLEGMLYQFQASADDPDSDALTFAVNGAPSWLSINPSTGLLSGTPGQDDVGVTSGIVVSVSDGEEDAKLAPFSLSVVDVNDAPSISGGSFSLVAGSRITITPSIADPDEDALTITVSSPPSIGSLSLEGDVWVYQAPENVVGSDSFSMQVSDGQLQSPPAQFNITLLPVQNLVTNDVLVEPAAPDEVYILDVLENDTANTDEALTLVASFSIFGDTFVESDLIRLELDGGDSQFITLDYIVENENGQLAVAQAVLVIQN